MLFTDRHSNHGSVGELHGCTPEVVPETEGHRGTPRDAEISDPHGVLKVCQGLSYVKVYKVYSTCEYL